MIVDVPRFIAVPRTLDEALQLLAERPELTVIAGGTDAMVAVNAGHWTPSGWLSLRHVGELRGIEERADGSVVIGARVTMASLALDQRPALQSLREAALTVGGPQIRSMATIGGNLATGSPAGDTLPPLLCADASVEVVSATSSRLVPVTEFLVGPKRTALGDGELIRAVHLPPRPGQHMFTKIGPRNAMVIAVCSLCVRLDRETRDSAVAAGSVAPTAIRLAAAEELLADPARADDFADAVARSVSPIDDVRGSAAYRTHAMRVLARRAHRALHDPAARARAAS
jgi:CO/xanthine dehydrogenase FAD-binding subunit